MKNLIDKIPLNTNLKAGIIGASIAAIWFGASTYTSYQVAESAREKTKVLETQKELQVLLTSLINRETGERGYALTGNIDYLEPYAQAQLQIERSLDRIQGLVAGDAQKETLVVELEKVVVANGKFLRRVVKARQAQGTVAAIKLIQTNEGKATMDKIRVLLDQMSEIETQVLKLKEEDFIRNVVVNNSTIVVLTGAVGYVVYKMVLLDATRQNLRDAEIAKQNKALELSGGLIFEKIAEIESITTDPNIDYEPLKHLIAEIAAGGKHNVKV